MDARVEVISPAYAKELLERSMPNRPLSEHTVARYAVDMADGLWINNGQGIVISDTGELLDGQHRLHAIIKSGKTVAMLVVRGVPRQAFVTMDSGKGRKLSDVLAIEGYKYRFNLGAAAKLAYNYIAGVSSSYTTSRGTLEQFIKRHPYISEMSDLIGHTVQHKHRLPKTQLIACLFLANESGLMGKEVSQFVEGLVYGEGLFRGDARHTFREWHRRVYLAEKHRTGGDTASLALFGAVVRSWNAFAAGRELTIIKNAYTITRETADIVGFKPELYGDVASLAVKARESALRNLRFAQAANASRTSAERGVAQAMAEEDVGRAIRGEELTAPPVPGPKALPDSGVTPAEMRAIRAKAFPSAAGRAQAR